MAAFLILGAAQADAPPIHSAQQVLHLLDYIAVEYPEFVRNGKVTDEAEYQEQVEFSEQVARTLAGFPDNEHRSALVTAAQQLHEAILAKAKGDQVVALARRLQGDLTATYDIRLAPASPPDLARGAALYEANCATCHGARGDGRGPAAGGLDPAPTDFTDHARQSQRSVLGLFNTISLGVDGTAMAAFSQLSDADRWALAFYVSRFAASDAEQARGEALWRQGGPRLFSGLSEVVTTTPAEAMADSPEKHAVLLYLRAHPDALSSPAGDALSVAQAKTEESLRLYAQGRSEEAYRSALAAYLDGFELAEALVSAETRARVEQKMVAYRSLLRSGAPVAEVSAAADELAHEFSKARESMSGGSASTGTNFVASLIIILREGLEAMLVIAAIAAFLARSGRRDALAYVHFGWIGALAAGGVTWIVSSTLFAFTGAQRETTEGVTALLAAAILLYAGYWLHSKSHSARWQAYIRGEISGAVSSGQLRMLGLVSFLAVYREAFETVLFMQALWVQADAPGRSALLAGIAAGAALLVVVAWLIARFSLRLPLRLFFTASAFFLAVLAVVFAGKGIAALQAAGKLPMTPAGLPSLPALGIYPNWQGLALQILIIVLIAMVFWYGSTNARRG